jgi:uncharacterized protein YlxW (UPF0749 family)
MEFAHPILGFMGSMLAAVMGTFAQAQNLFPESVWEKGWAGIFIACLLYAVISLRKENQRLHEERRKDAADMAEERKKESQTVAASNADLAEAIRNLSKKTEEVRPPGE